MWCFLYIEEETMGENSSIAYELLRKINVKIRINVHVKLLLHQKKLHFKCNKNNNY